MQTFTLCQTSVIDTMGNFFCVYDNLTPPTVIRSACQCNQYYNKLHCSVSNLRYSYTMMGTLFPLAFLTFLFDRRMFVSIFHIHLIVSLLTVASASTAQQNSRNKTSTKTGFREDLIRESGHTLPHVKRFINLLID